METFIKISEFILSLSLLVILHELGHFIPAKLFKTKVERFFLFFDVRFAIFKKKIGDTIYGIGWLPLGGYVKISGMVDESMDTEKLNEPPKPYEFRSKPAWQRLIIMVGGVLVNFFLAFIIYILLFYTYGDKKIDNKSLKNGVIVAKEMQVFGFRNGDKILSANGEEINYFNLNKHLFIRNINSIEVERKNGQVKSIKIPDTIGYYLLKNNIKSAFRYKRKTKIDQVKSESVADNIGLKNGDKIIKVNSISVEYQSDIEKILSISSIKSLTIKRGNEIIEKSLNLKKNTELGVFFESGIKITHQSYSFFESIEKGIDKGLWQIHDYFVQLKYLFTGSGIKQVGGIISIANIFPSSWEWYSFWNLTAFLSVMLAILNLLPIPALDGGHIVFLLYEAMTGKAPKTKILEIAQLIGFIIIIVLFLYANGNDFYRFFIK